MPSPLWTPLRSDGIRSIKICSRFIRFESAAPGAEEEGGVLVEGEYTPHGDALMSHLQVQGYLAH